MRRRNRNSHNWAWHEAQILDNERNGVTIVTGADGMPLPLRREEWLAWRRTEMARLDTMPAEFRSICHEHNLAGARAMWKARLMAQVQAEPQCRHGRRALTCPHCDQTRTLQRDPGRVAAILARRK